MSEPIYKFTCPKCYMKIQTENGLRVHTYYTHKGHKSPRGPGPQIVGRFQREAERKEYGVER